MATLAITNAFAYVGSHDYTGDVNMWRLSGEADALDCSNMRSGGWREYKMGLKKSMFEMCGHDDFAHATDATDPHTFNNLGTADNVFTTGIAETEGDPAFIHQGMLFNYTLGGSLGEITPFNVSGVGTDGPSGVVRGALALKKTTVSTTGAKGTALNLGLIGSGQYLYATLHLLGTAGSSITAIIQSDADNTWSSATTQISFGAQTAVGGYWGTRVAGPVADEDWFRLNVTAVSGSWSVACAIGIGS
jgi:hypothetical protein